MRGKGQTLLYVGDFSYADTYPFHDHNRWDTWGRFVERSTAYQPWIWTAGNHEIDLLFDVVSLKVIDRCLLFFDMSLKFNFILSIRERILHSRYTWTAIVFPIKPQIVHHNCGTPSREHPPILLFFLLTRHSVTTLNYSSFTFLRKVYLMQHSHTWVHICVGKYTPQYVWLKKELSSVDRTKTPWLIVLMHSPLYNSNEDHYMESETMRVQFESWFVQAKVDIVFAGHCHAYERSVSI